MWAVRCLVVVLVVFCLACLVAIAVMGLNACRPWHYTVDLGPTVPRPCVSDGGAP